MLDNEQKVFRKGDIYFCNIIDVGGSVQCGLRPALILQNDIGNKYSPTLIVAPITSVTKKKDLPTHIILGSRFGLKEDSMVMLEQIITVDKIVHVRNYIGRVDDRSIREINNALNISLGLSGGIK